MRIKVLKKLFVITISIVLAGIASASGSDLELMYLNHDTSSRSNEYDAICFEKREKLLSDTIEYMTKDANNSDFYFINAESRDIVSIGSSDALNLNASKKITGWLKNGGLKDKVSIAVIAYNETPKAFKTVCAWPDQWVNWKIISQENLCITPNCGIDTSAYREMPCITLSPLQSGEKTLDCYDDSVFSFAFQKIRCLPLH